MRLWQRIKEEFRNQPLTLSMAILGLVIIVLKAIGTAPSPFKSKLGFELPLKIELNLIVGILIFFFLQGSLGYYIGRLFVKIREKGRGFPIIWLNSLSLISAWISGFNCFWIFLPGAKNPICAFFLYYSAFLLAWACTIYFIRYQFLEIKQRIRKKETQDARKLKQLKAEKSENFMIVAKVQTIYFIFIAIYFGYTIYQIYL